MHDRIRKTSSPVDPEDTLQHERNGVMRAITAVLEDGKLYEIEYEYTAGNNRRVARVMRARYATSDTIREAGRTVVVALIFDGRPQFGTVTIPADWIRSLRRVDSQPSAPRRID